jgi:hypothetical protein
MSTIKVNKIENTSTTNGGVSIDNDGHVTIDGQQLPTAGPLSNRNMIVNGAMQVAQRGTSSTSAGYQTVDRFQSTYAGITQTQSQESLTTGDPYDEGFRYFYRVTNTSTSSASSAISELQQRIEGQNINQSGWNFKSSSSYLTISFWVRSSLAGTYYFYIYSPQTASIGYYRIPFTLSANTWTKVTHAIPGNSGITINNDSGIGLHCYWIPYYGTDYTGSTALTEQWDDKDGNDYIPDFAQNWCNTASATFDITGVQLEVGSKSTPFEHRSYSDELDRCWRYYQRFNYTDVQYQQITILTVPGTSSSTTGRGPIYWYKEMRATPDCDNSAGSTFRFNGGGLSDQIAGSISIDQISKISANINCADSTNRSRTSGFSGWLSRENVATTWIEADAEL